MYPVHLTRLAIIHAMKKGQGIVLLEIPSLLTRPTNVFYVLGYQLLDCCIIVFRTQSANAYVELQQIQSFGGGHAGEPIRPAVGGNAAYPVDDRSMMAARGMDSRNIGFVGGMPEPPLPPDASNTLYIEGVPSDCTRREVSRILRDIYLFCHSLFLNIYLHKL